MPSNTREAAALVTLLRTGSRSWREYVELVEEADGAVHVLDEERSGSLFAPDTGAAEADIECWQRQGIRLLSVLDADYPENLRGVHDRPPLIFIAGELGPRDSRSLAVIGGRKPSPQGLQAAVRISRHLTEQGYVVISGLAAGTDTAAHTAALGANGRTIAVIGTGLNRVYPPQNTRLQQQIAGAGAVVSQFWPDASPTRASFPKRNALMSGLALATVIVEASETSGTRTQARAALRHGRPVFLLESLVEEQPWARELARAPGTYVVGHPSEITAVVERLTAPCALTR